jgi:hypothetical protein
MAKDFAKLAEKIAEAARQGDRWSGCGSRSLKKSRSANK